jgi:hypothetical protein
MDREATQIIKSMRAGWLSLGLVVKKMIETQAFEQLGFKSVNAWMKFHLGEQLASGYQALRAIRALDAFPNRSWKGSGRVTLRFLSVVVLPAKTGHLS